MLPQRKFNKGLDASTSLYNQPQGSFPRCSNLVTTKRGSVRITDGNTTWSLRGATVRPNDQPIEDVLLVQIYGIIPFYLAIANPVSGFRMLRIGSPSWDPTTDLIFNLGFTNGRLVCRPKMLQFNNQIIIYGDPNATPYWWNGVNALTIGAISTWSAGAGFAVGDFITDGTNIQQVIIAGSSAGAPPTWATRLGDTTVDNTITWINRGPAVPQKLSNSFKPSYPQWLPDIEITSQQVIQVGFTGGGARLGYWQAGVAVAINTVIIDSNNNVQTATVGGTSGSGSPLWNVTGGGTTTDNTVTWTNGGAATFFNFLAQQTGVTGAGPQPPQFANTLNSTVRDGGVTWQNTGATSNSAIAPRGGKFAIVYAGSLWVLYTQDFTTADKQDGPTVLAMSDLNNPNSWNPVNRALIGKDDGTRGTGLATFTIAETGITPTGSLVVFKDYSTWQITGVFGSTNFAIIQAQTDMGCIAPDTIQFLPGYGIARLTHNGPAIFDGVRDKLFGEQIRPYIFGDVNTPDITPIYGGANPTITADTAFATLAIGCQTNNPPMYIMGGHVRVAVNNDDDDINRLFLYDMVQKSWTIIDLPFSISCLRQIRQQSTGVVVATMSGGSHDGAFRFMFNGATTWKDVATTGDSVTVQASLTTPEVFGKSAADNLYMRAVYVRGRGSVGGITIDLVFDNIETDGIPAKFNTTTSGEFEAWIPIHAVGKSCHIVVHANGPGEIHTIDWDGEEQPAAPGVLQ